MRDFGKDFEKDIDETLAALGSARPPAGMQARILQAVEERAAAPRGWSGWTLPVGAFGVVAVVVLIGWGLRHRVPENGAAVEPPSVATVSHTPQKASGERAAAGVKQRPKMTKYMVAAQTLPSEQRIVAGPEPPTEQERLLVRLAEAYDHNTVPDIAAIPPTSSRGIPISHKPTQEERLLVKVAATGDASQRAALDPEERQKQQEEMQEEFQKFLNEPTT